MSGYAKSSQAPDYDSRPSQAQQYSNVQPVYGAFTPHSHYSTAPSQPQRHRTNAPEQPPQHPPLALSEPLYSSRQYGELPQIIRSNPRSGPAGTHFTVNIHSTTDLTTDPRSFRFVFGTFKCISTSAPKPASRPDEYQLSVEVPAFLSPGWRSTATQKVFLMTEDEEGHQLGMEEVPHGFTYIEAPAPPSYSSPPPTNLKRKASSESAELISSVKRAATQTLRPKSSEDYGYGYPSATSGSQYVPYVSNADSERSYGVYSGYDHDSSHSGTYQPQSPHRFQYSYPGASELSHAPSGPSTHGWPSQFTPSTSAENSGIVPAPSDHPTPALIRTSTLQSVDKGGDGGRGPGSGFNPYSLYPHKAVLQIHGDLGDMSKNWTAEEWDARRRLVQFCRLQENNTIKASFRAVPQSDRPTSAVCVSCIWWEERSECYVTSVDCIYLLESLIAVRFTVEEKNRIRRNLEGFRPLTVSKGKKECESFFKLIMQFPSPKPRNIEKDVKVFAWSILPHALKKIIGKYSASYSSTASIIPQTPGASPYPGPPSHESPQLRTSENMPPRATHSPATIALVPTSSPSTAMISTTAPLTGGSTSAGGISPANRSRGLSDPHIPLPGIVPVTNSHALWQQSQPLPTTPHSIPPTSTHRVAWGTSPFMGPSSASSTSAYYQREHVSTEDRSTLPGTQSSTQTINNTNTS